MITNRYQHTYFFILFLASLVLMYYVGKPFIVPVFIALVCSVVFRSYNDYLSRKFHSESLAAIGSVITVIALIIIPLGIISVLVFFEARDLYTKLSVDTTPGGALSQSISSFQKQVQVYAPNLNLDIQSYIRSGLDWLISHTSTLFSSFLKVLLDLFIMIMALFYLLKDGKKLRGYFLTLSPLDDKDDSNILTKLEVTINSVVRGTLIVSLVQGIMVAIGFTIFGIGQPVLWGLVAAFTSLIPGVGTSLVNIPTVIILFTTGHTYTAFGYAAWALMLVGMIDNFLAPHLIERKVNIHPFLILISVLGGLVFFGPVGFLAGPIVLAFVVELLKLYPKFTPAHD